MGKYNCPVNNFMTYTGWCYNVFLLVLDRCWFSVSNFGRFISDTDLIVVSDGYISYL